jgi:Uma2 family endonuclease
MSDRKPARKATYRDVLEAPPHLIAEILDGELVLSPRPAGAHQSVTGKLFSFLDQRFSRGGKPGGWLILIEPELRLGHNVNVPDLAGWRLERMPYVEDGQKQFTMAPDWICETLSPWTERDDRTRKQRIYARHRVGQLWFLHPVNRTLEVHRRHGARWLNVGAFAEDERVRAEPFADVDLDLAKLWVDLAPRPSRASELAAMYAGKTIHVYPEC